MSNCHSFTNVYTVLIEQIDESYCGLSLTGAFNTRVHGDWLLAVDLVVVMERRRVWLQISMKRQKSLNLNGINGSKRSKTWLCRVRY